MAQEPEVYMPALPASSEVTIGKVPLAPVCAATRLTGARQSGGVEVAEAVGVEVSVFEGVGVAVRVVEGVGVEVSEGDGVAVPVRDCELLGVDVSAEEDVPVSLRV